MWAIQVHEAEENADSAFGWWVQHNSAELIVDHPGVDNGFQRYFCRWVDRLLSMVVLCYAVWSELRIVMNVVINCSPPNNEPMPHREESLSPDAENWVAVDAPEIIWYLDC